jgi:hypothetical protein
MVAIMSESLRNTHSGRGSNGSFGTVHPFELADRQAGIALCASKRDYLVPQSIGKKEKRPC